jgi:hypothetical protein
MDCEPAPDRPVDPAAYTAAMKAWLRAAWPEFGVKPMPGWLDAPDAQSPAYARFSARQIIAPKR